MTLKTSTVVLSTSSMLLYCNITYSNSCIMLTVFNSILHCPQSVMNGIFDLRQCVFIWTFNQDGDRQWVLALFDKCVLLLALQTR